MGKLGKQQHSPQSFCHSLSLSPSLIFALSLPLALPSLNLSFLCFFLSPVSLPFRAYCLSALYRITQLLCFFMSLDELVFRAISLSRRQERDAGAALGSISV